MVSSLIANSGISVQNVMRQKHKRDCLILTVHFVKLFVARIQTGNDKDQPIISSSTDRNNYNSAPSISQIGHDVITSAPPRKKSYPGRSIKI